MTTLMKDSGIDWIGEIPEGWKVKRLKDISKVSTGNTPPRINDFNFSKNKAEGVKWIKPENLNNDLNVLIEETKEYITSQGEKYIKVFKDNSIIMSGIGDIGKIGLSNGRFSTNQQNHIVYNIEGNYKFLSYYILSSNFRLKSISSGTVVPILNATNFKLLECVIPPLETQQKIADYLDVEVSRLDKQVSLLEHKYALLGDYKDALIFETVTQGLDKAVPMKDSGIDWIGEIPEGWEFKRLKDVCYGASKGVTNFEGVKPYLSTKSIKENNIENIEDYVSFDSRPSRANLSPLLGAVSFAKMKNTKKVVLVNEDIFNKYIWSTGFSFLKSKKIISSFLYYVINSSYFDFQKNELSYGTTQEAINDSSAGLIKIIYPKSLETQKKIAEYLDVEVEKLDKQRELIKRKVELLKEYKEALIFEVVTGKKEVK